MSGSIVHFIDPTVTCVATGYDAFVRGDFQVRRGGNETWGGPNDFDSPFGDGYVAPAQIGAPSFPRMRNAMSAPPSSRLAPSQSQPCASSASSSLDHSWSSHATPLASRDSPCDEMRPVTRRCGSL